MSKIAKTITISIMDSEDFGTFSNSLKKSI
jgi:hypothetical protein